MTERIFLAPRREKGWKSFIMRKVKHLLFPLLMLRTFISVIRCQCKLQQNNEWLIKVDLDHLQQFLPKQMLSNLSWAENGNRLIVFYGCEVVDSLKNAPLVGLLDTPSWTASKCTRSKIKPITARTSAETTILQDPKRYINISRCWQVCQKTHNIVPKVVR